MHGDPHDLNFLLDWNYLAFQMGAEYQDSLGLALGSVFLVQRMATVIWALVSSQSPMNECNHSHKDTAVTEFSSSRNIAYWQILCGIPKGVSVPKWATAYINLSGSEEGESHESEKRDRGGERKMFWERERAMRVGGDGVKKGEEWWDSPSCP